MNIAIIHFFLISLPYYTFFNIQNLSPLALPLQTFIEAFAEAAESPYGCLLIGGRIVAATERWWGLTAGELTLLSTLLLSLSECSARDVPVYLPHGSPAVRIFHLTLCSVQYHISTLSSILPCVQSSITYLHFLPSYPVFSPVSPIYTFFHLTLCSIQYHLSTLSSILPCVQSSITYLHFLPSYPVFSPVSPIYTFFHLTLCSVQYHLSRQFSIPVFSPVPPIYRVFHLNQFSVP